MKQKLFLTFLVAVCVLVFVGAAHAQQPRPTPTNVPSAQSDGDGGDGGSIRGVVYRDQNGDGRCGPGDPVLAAVPLRFVSDDGQTTVFLQSGDDGSYGLAAAGYGGWNVSVEPPSGWVVTSAQPARVNLTSEQRLALNVNFCVAEGSVVRQRVTLPQAGAPLAPIAAALLAALGIAFVGLGAAWRRFVEK